MHGKLCEAGRGLLASLRGSPEVASLFAAHAETCVECDAALDDPENAAALLASIVPDGELRSVDEVLSEQERREKPVVEAVSVLLASLSDATAKRIAPVLERHGAGVVNAAAEAVSTLLWHYLKLESPGATLVFHPDGSASDGDETVLTADGAAWQIARYADLWEDPMAKEAKPHPDTHTLAAWLWQAAEETPFLLRHFSSQPVDAKKVLLTEVSAAELDETPLERWSPAAEEAEPEEQPLEDWARDVVQDVPVRMADPWLIAAIARRRQPFEDVVRTVMAAAQFAVPGDITFKVDSNGRIWISGTAGSRESLDHVSSVVGLVEPIMQRLSGTVDLVRSKKEDRTELNVRFDISSRLTKG